MQRKPFFSLIVLLPALALFSTPAYSALIANGSFEDTSATPWTGGFQTLYSGSTAIPGWTVTSGSIDWINNYWQNHDGSYSLDLSGNGPGAISQTFATVSGQQYKVTFWMSGNPDYYAGQSDPVKELTLDVGAGTEDFSFTIIRE